MNRMYSMHATPDKRTSDRTKVSDISIYKDSTQAMGPTHVTDDTRNVMSTENMASIGAKRNTDNTDVKSVTIGIYGVHGTNYVDGKGTSGTKTPRTPLTSRISRTRFHGPESPIQRPLRCPITGAGSAVPMATRSIS